MTTRLTLVVTSGRDVGASIVVDAEPRRIGRAKDSDLALSDRAVSRHHLEVLLEDGALRIRCVDDASPFVAKGEATTDALVRAGDVVMVGDTALAVVVDRRSRAADAASSTSGHDLSHTDARGLFGRGAVAAVRGLAATAELVDALDELLSTSPVAEDALEAAVDRWARERLGADGAMLTTQASDGAAERPAPWLVSASEAKDGITEIAAGTQAGGALVVRVRSGSSDDDALRVVTVAARVVASALARLESSRALEENVSSLRTLAVGSARSFLGSSPAATSIARMIPKLAASDSSVLLTGESGTGKTFLARIIHEASGRAKHVMRVMNCAAIPENLLESELFGHERGAFTGALAARAGAFEAVGHGTLFLDEIGELPLPSQAKLLRALEERRFERVGSNRSLPLEARVVAATNRDLLSMVEAGTFRADLYYRISVVTVHVPPLRERGDDVVRLADQVLADLLAAGAGGGRRVRGFSDAAMAELKRRAWPGNVRELRNAIERAIVLGESPFIEASDLPSAAPRGPGAAPAAEASRPSVHVTLPATLASLEERAIDAALAAANGNQKEAAALLGINRVTLYKKLRARTAVR